MLLVKFCFYYKANQKNATKSQGHSLHNGYNFIGGHQAMANGIMNAGVNVGFTALMDYDGQMSAGDYANLALWTFAGGAAGTNFSSLNSSLSIPKRLLGAFGVGFASNTGYQMSDIIMNNKDMKEFNYSHTFVSGATYMGLTGTSYGLGRIQNIPKLRWNSVSTWLRTDGFTATYVGIPTATLTIHYQSKNKKKIEEYNNYVNYRTL